MEPEVLLSPGIRLSDVALDLTMEIIKTVESGGISYGLKHFAKASFDFEEVLEGNLLRFFRFKLGPIGRAVQFHVTVWYGRGGFALPRMWYACW